MHSYILPSLPPLLHAHRDSHSPPFQLSETESFELPAFHPLFFIPPLEDRPQNPIVESLAEVPPHSRRVATSRNDPVVHEQVKNVGGKREEDEGAGIWTESRVVSGERTSKNQNHSWDALRATYSTEPRPSPFLTSQPNDVFDAVRHLLRPRVHDPSLYLLYVLPAELLTHLLLNVVGNSSPLFIWDAEVERLISRGRGDGKRVLVILEGLDEAASTPFIERFLNIGTLMRRLDGIVTSLQRKTSQSTPTTHAFAHALSSALAHLRTSLSTLPPYPPTHLTSLWLHYADTEETLIALASLCHRTLATTPPYTPLPPTPATLLSHTYTTLEQHIEQNAPRPVRALLAYILSIASTDCFRRLEEKLGMGGLRAGLNLNAGLSRNEVVRPRNGVDVDADADMGFKFDLDSEGLGLDSEDDDLKTHELPEFIPPVLVAALPAACKSLRILQAADLSHPLLCAVTMREADTCRWVWTEEEVELLWMGKRGEEMQGGVVVGEPVTREVELELGPPSKYEPELAQLSTFDLEPGTHLPPSFAPNPNTNPDPIPSSTTPVSLASFLTSFPPHLPRLTPTLPHLASTILQPLTTRTALLSQALLTLYLGPLRLGTHLTLMKSYMMATEPAFRARLCGALFEDGGEEDDQGHERGMYVRGGGGSGGSELRIGIGLAHGLAPPGTWPPGGADLSYFLRGVVVDSLLERTGAGVGVEVGGEEAGTGAKNGADAVWQAGETRLGFAVRDLAVTVRGNEGDKEGGGRARWLDAMSIEAFDFLYLDYKPPRPLDVVITPDILSKYHPETVSRIAYRNIHKYNSPNANPLFAYTPKAHGTLLALRFQMQAFITAFTAYVFDSVIGAEFDAWMLRLESLRQVNAERREGVGDDGNDESRSDDLEPECDAENEITDIFALRDSHSALLDDILSGCLLRSAQRGAGDALRSLFELVLQFGALTMGLQNDVGEVEGAERLAELNVAFQRQICVFIKAVQLLHGREEANGKDKSYFQITESDQHSHYKDLLTRIDPTGWWRQKIEKQTKHAV
ncbi:hypothetical protein K439DRAFT_1624581 [Ramaria rubella]|nr:hypothetical protein K439DRAFT_1624581 [Ramaria rubella]